MKKVICTAAAFMMVAGAATVASANSVTLSGDARVRWVYNDAGLDDFLPEGSVVHGLESNDSMNSRVRLKINAKTESGAYAAMRLRFWDHTWGDLTDSYGAMKGANGDNLYTDYAYLGTKIGKNFDVSAGKMIIGFTPWFLDDGRADRLKFKYAANGLMVAYTFDMKVETFGVDEDTAVHGITYKQKFTDAVTAMARAVYVNSEDKADKTGFKGSANVAMHFAGNNIILEQSWKDADTVYGSATNNDDHWGGYAEWNANLGMITPVVRLGYTADGFTADETFGWIMIGGDEPISKITRVGQGGDTLFLGMSGKFQASEDLNMQANFVYMDIDTPAESAVRDGFIDGVASSIANAETVAALAQGGIAGAGGYGENPFEISGQATYDINKNCALTGKVGYLSSDGALDDAVGAYARMAVKF